MDSDNSNRKTSYFHAQKILDAAADIKTKKVEEWELRRYKMIPYTWKLESIQKKKSHVLMVLIYSIGLYTKWSTSSVRQHFMYLLSTLCSTNF